MKNSKACRNYSGNLQRPKKSISRRWSTANAAFFFIVIFIFAAVLYQVVFHSIEDQNKAGMRKAMQQISQQMQQSNEPMTVDNIADHFKFRASRVENEAGQLIQTSSVMSQMISSRNMNFYIFDNKRNLIFTTSETDFKFHPDTAGNILTTTIGNRIGYLDSKAVRSNGTGQIVAYLITYYDLTPYYNLRSTLFNSFLIVGIVTLLAMLFFGYWMASSFIRPLKRIERSMAKVIAEPVETFEPVKIKQDDEIKLIADFYNQMMDRINYYLENQKSFVSDVSHELRTPLAVIEGHLQLLNRWGKDEPEVLDESLKITIDEVKNMKYMLEEMLALSRIEKLPEQELRQKTAAVKALESVLSNFRMLHPDFVINLLKRINDSDLIQMSNAHYQQAVTILLDNAVKYSGTHFKEIGIEITEDEDYVLTSISDKGIGIAPEDVNLVFERFFRADQARSSEISGTGLGLAILSNMVKQYKGEVTVNSQLGKGSTFALKIPKAPKTK